MYIIYKDGKFACSDHSDYAVAEIGAPAFLENHTEVPLALARTSEDKYIYVNAENQVEIRIEQKNDTLFYIHIYIHTHTHTFIW